METKLQFQKNANVLNANGELIGYLDRVVLNPDTRVITQVVIRKGAFLSKDERVVPIAFIADTVDNDIILHEEAEDLDAFSLFVEPLPVDASDYVDVPPFEKAESLYPGAPGIGMPPKKTAPGQEFIAPDRQENILQGTVAMKEGAKVVDLDGDYVGDVEQVLADSMSDHQATHLLVSRGLLMKATKLIPINWVMAFGEERIHLGVKKDLVEELEDVSINE